MQLDYEAIGRRIRFCREELKITQAKLSELAQLEPSNISHIERGATKLSLPSLMSICNALGVSTDEILYDSIDENRHITNDVINEILSDFSNKELMAMAELIKTVKNLYTARK